MKSEITTDPSRDLRLADTNLMVALEEWKNAGAHISSVSAALNDYMAVYLREILRSTDAGAELPPKWRPGLMVQRCPIGGYMACDTDRCDGTYGYGSTEEEAIADLDAMDSYDDSTFHQHSGRFADND